MLMNSPGDTPPPRKLAPFTMLVIAGVGAVTVSVTGTVPPPVAPVPGVTVIDPLYVPATRPEGLTLTASGTDAEELALPLVGLTESHPEGVLVALAVKLAADEPAPVTVTVCADGAALPAA
jgi:hypothetical protein